jgi:deoxyribodipyrimidine photo-lyase
VFVFDRDILDPLPSHDRRVEFLHDSLVELDRDLADLGSDVRLITVHARAIDAIPELARTLGVDAVFANHDDEPASLARDAAVADVLAADGIAWRTSKDHVVFERSEVLTLAGKPYSVFTPYKNAWLKKLEPQHLEAYPVATLADALAPVARPVLPTGFTAGPLPLDSLGFVRTNLHELRVCS